MVKARSLVFWWLLVVAGVILMASSARAERVAGVSVPDRVLADGHVLVLNGAGVHEVGMFGVDVYVGALYLEHRSSDASQILASSEPKRLLMRFVRDLSRDDLREALGALDRRTAAKLSGVLGRVSAIHRGDVLVASQSSEQVVELQLNGTVLGRLSGAATCRQLFANWLGPRSVSSKLRRKLLGRARPRP